MRVRRQMRCEVALLRRMLKDARELHHPDLAILGNPEKFLFKPLEATAGIGVKVFVYTHGLKALYVLGVAIIQGPPFYFRACQHAHAACTLLPCMEGAAFLASTIAIYNLVVFEHSLKEILNRERFAPVLKFLNVKLLVSITFIQSLAMDAAVKHFMRLSQEQAELCRACFLCFEVLPLSLLTTLAWRPRKGDWYDGDRRLAHGSNTPEGRLAGEPDWCTGYRIGSMKSHTQPSRKVVFADPSDSTKGMLEDGNFSESSPHNPLELVSDFKRQRSFLAGFAP